MSTAAVLAWVGVAASPPADARAAAGPSCPWVSSAAPVAQRVDQLLARMTLADKVHELHGDNSSAYAGTVPAIPRLCIPALTLDDSPSGVGHGMSGVTQLPAGVSLASTWDTGLGKKYGAVIGKEQWGKGNDVDLGPTVNIVRDPRWGRAFETYGEDPYLAGQMGAADVNGIQGTGEMAQLKHLAVYNQETNRNSSADNAIVDERVEQEIYLSQFGAVIKQAHPASVMCSYSFINGENACQDPYILTQVLRNQWHYKGFVTSDWGGTHSTVPAAEAGLNMQMPDGSFYGAPLEQAVTSGQLSMATIDGLVRPILTEMFRFHLFTDPPTGTPSSVVTTPAHQMVGQRVAEDGTVLLKNAHHILPLSPTRKSSIAVIGADAGTDAMTTGGGSAAVVADSIVTPYQGIAARAGKNVTVRYAQGNSSGGGLPAVPASVLTPGSGSGSGLTARYYQGATPAGTALADQNVGQVDFNWNGAAPAAGVPTNQWSATYTGTITAPTTGSYTFSLTSDDGSRLFVNGQQVIDNWRDQAATTRTGTVTLTAGQRTSIEVDYYQGGGGSLLHLGWQPPGGPSSMLQQAVDTARSSDVAVVFASNFESEGGDLPTIDLPADENALIAAVAAVNPNTVVVLNTGSAVTMPWLSSVNGVFEAWYPGQSDGDAIASLLFGDVNPSGKLPVTFPRKLSDVPASTPAQWPGVDGRVQFSEGLDVGYRWYDAKHIDPMFAFGSGLSYTTFGFSHLRIDPLQTSSLGTVRVRADVTNTGKRSGADVVQLYVGIPARTGEPPAQLKGFQKVNLRPGQRQQVSFTVPAHDLATWDDSTHTWKVADGTYRLMVGDASDHLPQRGTIRVVRSYGPQGVSMHAPTILTPGRPVQVTATFTNEADVPVRDVAIRPGVPRTWRVSPTTAIQRVVPPHSQVSVSFTVTAPASAQPRSYSLTMDASFDEQRVGHGKVTQATQTLRVPYASWASAYNNVGISDDSDPAAANFDGSGYSYSAQQLAAVGITPGGAITSGSASFTWPNVPAGQPDNIATQGQVIAMTGTGNALHLLGAGAPGMQSGDVTVTYTDGESSTATVALADWWANSPATGDTLVATTANWNQPLTGGQGPHKVSLYATSVPLRPGKTIAYVSLPNLPSLHLFAASVS